MPFSCLRRAATCAAVALLPLAIMTTCGGERETPAERALFAYLHDIGSGNTDAAYERLCDATRAVVGRAALASTVAAYRSAGTHDERTRAWGSPHVSPDGSTEVVFRRTSTGSPAGGPYRLTMTPDGCGGWWACPVPAALTGLPLN